MASMIARLQEMGMEVSTDTLQGMSVTVAKGSDLRPAVSSGSRKAYTAVRILAAASGSIGPAIALGAPGPMRIFFCVVIGPFEAITTAIVDEFSHKAGEYSKQLSKAARMKSVVCIPVFLTNNAPDDAKVWVRTKAQSHSGAAVIPVIADLANGVFSYLERTPLSAKILYTSGLQLVGSCIRIPPLEEEREISLECQHCKMKYIYRVTVRQDKVACRNCNNEISFPPVIDATNDRALQVVREIRLECPYCSQRYIYGLRQRQETVVCKNCNMEFPVSRR